MTAVPARMKPTVKPKKQRPWRPVSKWYLVLKMKGTVAMREYSSASTKAIYKVKLPTMGSVNIMCIGRRRFAVKICLRKTEIAGKFTFGNLPFVVELLGRFFAALISRIVFLYVSLMQRTGTKTAPARMRVIHSVQRQLTFTMKPPTTLLPGISERRAIMLRHCLPNGNADEGTDEED